MTSLGKRKLFDFVSGIGGIVDPDQYPDEKGLISKFTSAIDLAP
jgi:hypothetical protein